VTLSAQWCYHLCLENDEADEKRTTLAGANFFEKAVSSSGVISRACIGSDAPRPFFPLTEFVLQGVTLETEPATLVQIPRQPGSTSPIRTVPPLPQELRWQGTHRTHRTRDFPSNQAAPFPPPSSSPPFIFTVISGNFTVIFR